MKLFTKVLAGVAVAAALATSAHASLITIDGVSWNPDSPLDFQATSNFAQWYQPALAFNPTGPVTSFTTALGLVGNYVTGAGKFNTVNGVNQIQNDPIPETFPAVFAPGRELTYTYGGILLTSFNAVTGFTFDLTNSYVKVYSDTPPDYPESSGLLADQIKASGGALFLAGQFDIFNLSASVLTNGALFGSASGLISVTGGDAFGNFDTNQQILGNIVSDLTFTGSSQINVGSKISKVATAELVGNTVPEPATIALVGMALLAAGVSSRRRRTDR